MTSECVTFSQKCVSSCKHEISNRICNNGRRAMKNYIIIITISIIIIRHELNFDKPSLNDKHQTMHFTYRMS